MFIGVMMNKSYPPLDLFDLRYNVGTYAHLLLFFVTILNHLL